MRKIVVAFDHAGVDLRDVVLKTVKECGCEVIDVGTNSHTSVDFPDYAYIASHKILDREAEKGIFVCGSGVGMCLSANKIKGIYAAVCHDTYTARQAVEHDDINVLCLGSRVIGPELARELIIAYLNASFNNMPNQVRRMNKVRLIEKGDYEPKNNSLRLFENGQSIWLDNIRRGLIKSGKLSKDIEHQIIRGITSNPSIFKKAIADSRDYENALVPMSLAHVSPENIFNSLVVEDIRNSADLFRDLYIQSNGNDGFVSLEVNPDIAHDTERTITEAKNLWKSVNRPNLMIKVPATVESLPTITELTASGINLNITLIFSPARYEEAANAYIQGLRKRLENGEPIDRIRSVASVFVSRIDTKVDSMLAEKGISARSFLGKTAIRNAQKIYNLSLQIFSSEEFIELQKHGGTAQRVLWASTSVKNPQYKPTYYVEALIGPNTINTVPPTTLDALLQSLSIRNTLPAPAEDVTQFFKELKAQDINIEDVYEQLETEGIAAFEKDYAATLTEIQKHSDSIRRNMKNLDKTVLENYLKVDEDSVMRRIFSKDPTVWTFDTQAFAEIRNRLGWLDTFKSTENHFEEYVALRNEIKQEGISKILVLGIGGPVITSDVTSRIFADETDIDLQILDTSDPIQIREICGKFPPKSTLYIVSCKPGGMAEVRPLLKYVYNQAAHALGDKAGSHFIAITDPGTSLESAAKELGFRKIFLSDLSVGSRYSALTPFGMIPAILMGLDTQKISRKVQEIMRNCSPSLQTCRNEGAALGIFMASAAANGHDKLTVLTDKAFQPLGSWIEQLVAGSTGKEGKGIIPIIDEPEAEKRIYPIDRCFVYINYNNSLEEKINEINAQGFPLYEISVNDRYDIFSEFYRWEIAVAVACSILGVNAFDHPNILETKSKTTAKINEYIETGKLEDLPVSWSDESAEVWVNELPNSDEFKSYSDIITRFISSADAGADYIAIDSYLPQTTEMMTWLQELRGLIQRNTNCATMLNFGPHFHYTTGQLQKGGKNNGLFIQIVADYDDILTIPDEIYSFNLLERAQSLADFESLVENGRRVMRIRFKNGLPDRE